MALHHRGLAFISLLLLAADRTAHAQTDFSTLKLRGGDAVFISEATGVETQGRVVSLSPTSLVLDSGRTFSPETTVKIDRRGDPPWNGLIIGAIAGALATAAGGWGETSAASLLLSGGLVWGGIGLAIDLDHAGRTTVFRRSAATVRVSSAVAPGRRAFSVTVSF